MLYVYLRAVAHPRFLTSAVVRLEELDIGGYRVFSEPDPYCIAATLVASFVDSVAQWRRRWRGGFCLRKWPHVYAWGERRVPNIICGNKNESLVSVLRQNMSRWSVSRPLRQ